MFVTSKSNLPDGMHHAPLDPRSVCNLMLDQASSRIQITNLALQKLLYFAHGLFLTRYGAPLISGYFEAWRYGPVNPSAYAAFKLSKDNPITFRANKINPLTGEISPLENPTDETVMRHTRWIVESYGTMTAGRLVEIAHADGGPWHEIIKRARYGVAFGLVIPNAVICERFKHHKVSVGMFPAEGEPVKKPRSLPQQYLATYAPLEIDEQRRELRKMAIGIPKFSYDPFRKYIPELLNVKRNGTLDFGSVSLNEIKKAIIRSCSKSAGIKPNVSAAESLNAFAIDKKTWGKEATFSPFNVGFLAVGYNAPIKYWHDIAISLNGKYGHTLYRP